MKLLAMIKWLGATIACIDRWQDTAFAGIQREALRFPFVQLPQKSIKII
jgi:hypothetical protein